MNVILYSHWYPSHLHPYLGIFVKKHARAIAKAGVNIRVLSCVSFPSEQLFKKTINRFIDENGIYTVQILVESKFYKLFHLFPFLQKRVVEPEFKKMNEDLKADLLHSTIIFPSALLASDLANKYGIPHVITEHWTKIDRFMRKSFFASKAKKVYAQAKCVTAVSLFLKRNIEQYDTSDNVIRIPNVIDNRVFHYRDKKASTDSVTFTCVAQWNYPKRLDLIMESLEQLSGSISKKIHIHVIGNGVMAEEYKKRKWNFSTEFSSNIPPEKIAEKIHASDFFIHASDIETFSVVIAEALCTGTPVIASNNTAIVELIEEKNGILCDNDLASWLAGLKKLLNIKYDHSEIAKIAERFSEEKIGEMFREVYAKALAK